MSVEVVGIIAGALLLAFLFVLLLCAFIVARTKATKGFRDLAEVIRAFGTMFSRRPGQ